MSLNDLHHLEVLVLSHSQLRLHQVGVLLDVDGVLLRGGAVIPAARRALRKLVDKDQSFLVPVVFVTNAGSCQRHHKAAQLSRLLEVQVGRLLLIGQAESCDPRLPA